MTDQGDPVTTPRSEKHQPGEAHQYDLTCRVCGQNGTVSVSVEPQYAAPTVAPGHNHTTDGYPTFPVFRDACPLGCDAARADEIAAISASGRPHLSVVDPFREAAAMKAVEAPHD